MHVRIKRLAGAIAGRKLHRRISSSENMPSIDGHASGISELARYYSSRAILRWRVATARMRTLPQFIVAGAPKCGTTALYRYLLSHPQIIAPLRNEPGFFSQNYERGLNWYQALFPLKSIQSWRGRLSGNSTITGEHTPSYLVHPLAAQRIATTLPNVRLIILLRDPVDRAYSHYQHEFRCGHESLAFRDAIKMERQRTAKEIDRMRTEPGYRSPEYVRHAYFDQGIYRPKLEQLFKYFDRSRIMIIKSENLSERTQAVFDGVLEFLSLEPLTLGIPERINTGKYQPLHVADPELDGDLRRRFGPSNESLYSLLGVNFGW